MAVIAGLPYFDSDLYYQTLPILYSSFHHDLFFMHTCDWMLVEIRYRMFKMCHKLQAFKIRSGQELAGHRSSH